ncbi:hypothetical protein [Candidatus Endomicrobiellum trichonymphae]|uniref:Uncharacterized protein n=1 Tax=Endomicrobium trichonymphae TaxID=1408204 RepID=B1H0R9_ENDTX|nr:hypothetical protein [Candidatus Endomicrobium trichonymphae]BAG14246.1 hypothetical protein TGRD_P1-2 [Candidatus Endomicrobium trichonymphae]
MKKLICFVMLGCFVLTFVSCGKRSAMLQDVASVKIEEVKLENGENKTPPPDDPAPEDPETITKADRRVGIIAGMACMAIAFTGLAIYWMCCGSRKPFEFQVPQDEQNEKPDSEIPKLDNEVPEKPLVDANQDKSELNA